MNLGYNKAGNFYKKFFSGRIQKISVDAGFTCPNRDGKKGYGGCTYCNNNVFKPYYCIKTKSITNQLEEGKRFFGKKYKTSSYLAYFQAYSNTYSDLDFLKKVYEEALSVNDVKGLVIATRPDCINEDILSYISFLSRKYFVLIEYGVETINNNTLALVNRKHTFEEAVDAINLTKKYGIYMGIHLIFGLPGETRAMMLNSAKVISKLPIELIKFHHLQIVKGSIMEKDYRRNADKYKLFKEDEYIDFVIDFVERLNPDFFIERFIGEVPNDYLIAPKWGGIKNYEFTSKVLARMKERQTYQGRLFNHYR